MWRLFRARSFLTFRQTIECRFTQKLVRDMIIIYSYNNNMHLTDKYSQHSSIIWPVWLNSWVFVYELFDCGFESRCCYLDPFSFGILLTGLYIHEINEKWYISWKKNTHSFLLPIRLVAAVPTTLCFVVSISNFIMAPSLNGPPTKAQDLH